MLRREFVTALDKQLKTLKISRNASVDHIGVAMTTPAERSKAPPGVCTERKLTHDETFEAPADVVIRFKVSVGCHCQPSCLNTGGSHIWFY